ncbi:MAG: translocation/assembly module TamB domain-containing protein, partial [Desulfurivibrionaceae bacterium]
LDLNGSWDQPEGYVILNAEEIVPTGKVEEIFASPINLTANLLARKDGVDLKSAVLESERYSGQATGSYRHSVSIEELLQKPRSALAGEVSLDGAVRLKDLNFLSQRLSWLRRLEGDLQGEVHVEGPLADPGIKGALSLRDGEASHTLNFPMLTAVNLQADFNEQSITINELRAELGGAPINLGGRISREEKSLVFALHGDGKNVLLFRNNYMLARGNVKLEVNGPLERLAVNGSVGLTYGYYTRNIDFLGKIGSSSAPVSEGVGSLFSFPEPPLKNAVFNIRITAIEPFRIRNNLIRSALRPQLSLKGTGELPYLVGTIYIDSSRLLLPSGRLRIQSGVVVFLEEDPNRPRLDIIGRSQVMGYDINVVTSGPVTDPVITISSSPALPNDDLLLLLLTGKPPPEDAAGNEISGTRNVMIYLGRDFLGKWLEDDSTTGDESILDRFELDLGRNVTRSGEQTIEATFRLSKELEEDEVVYYLAAEKDKYDAYNYGLRVVFRFE